MVKNINKENGRVVTEGFLKRTLNEQNKINFEIFVTKQDLKEGLGGLREELRNDLNKNQTYLEKIVAKLDKKEQENAMHGYQHKITEDRLADHDKRIEKLEGAVA